MSTVLDEIVAATRASLRQRNPDEQALRRRVTENPARSQFSKVLRLGRSPRIIAEIKAASPSAGPILDRPDVEAIAATYARSGASAISVVTEPRFFSGSIDWVRRAAAASRRPVLMKDFVIEPVQIYEAALAGADAILLIAAILPRNELRRLLRVVTEVGMEALVEVHNEEEMSAALHAKAEIIGVNNRDLRDFSVDLGTSERLVSRIPVGVLKVTESGIRSREDVTRLLRAGFDAFLVGEALLRQPDLGQAVRDLTGEPQVKICGVTRVEDARAAAEAGASFIGLVFAPESPRRVDVDRAEEIVRAVGARAATAHGQKVPSFVGVFRDQSVEEIRGIVDRVPLDYIQLHGSETPEQVAQMPLPVIKALPVKSDVPDTAAFAQASWILFDASSPGAGKHFDWSLLEGYGREKRFFLAGGLNAENVVEAIRRVHPNAIDISTGVEDTPGIKSAEKIHRLFEAVHSA